MTYPKSDLCYSNQQGERGLLPQQQQQSRGSFPPDIPVQVAENDFLSINRHAPVPSPFLSAAVSLLTANLPSSNDDVGTAINCDAKFVKLVGMHQEVSAAAALREVVESDYPENFLLRLCLRSCQDVDNEGNLAVYPRFIRVKYGAGLSTLVECIYHDREADSVMQESQVPLVISHSAMDYSANAGQNAMIRHLRVRESPTKPGYAIRTEVLQDMDDASLSDLFAASTTSVPVSPPEISTNEGAASTKKKRRKKQGKEKGETDNDEATKEARVARRGKKGASTGKGGKTSTKSSTPSRKKAISQGKKRGVAEASSSAQTRAAGKTGEGPSMASPPETLTKEGAAFTKKKGGKKKKEEKDEIEDGKEDASSIAKKGAAAGKEDGFSSESDSEAEAANKDEGKSTTEKSGKNAKKKRSVTTGKGNEAAASQEDAPADESKAAETPPKKKHRVTQVAYHKRAKLHDEITAMKQGHGEDWCKFKKRDVKVDEMRSLINLMDVPLAKRDQKLSKASKDLCEDSIEMSRLKIKDYEKSFLELESWLAEHKEVIKTGNGKDIDHDEFIAKRRQRIDQKKGSEIST